MWVRLPPRAPLVSNLIFPIDSELDEVYSSSGLTLKNTFACFTFRFRPAVPTLNQRLNIRNFSFS